MFMLLCLTAQYYILLVPSLLFYTDVLIKLLNLSYILYAMFCNFYSTLVLGGTNNSTLVCM